MKLTARCVLVLFFFVGQANASLIPVDLSTWSSEGAGTWNTAPDNNSVLQSQNGAPTVFFESGTNAQGTQLSGTISVGSSTDDDFIGFVLGFQSGELSGGGEFYLVDWKKNDQNFGGLGRRGLSLSHVTTPLAESNYWTHTGGVTEVQRAANLGSTGWANFITYNFDLVFTDTLIQVYVEDILEINYAGNFSDGAFGFYNYSQNNVTYAGLTTRQAPNVSVPEPSTLMIFLGSLLGVALGRKHV